MKTLARIIALLLFFVRRRALALLALMHVVVMFALWCALLAARGLGPLASFITANGTTANEWQIAGPTGPGFVDDAGALDILPNVNLAGAPGTGALQFGQLTGPTALPTGALTWASNAAGALSLRTDGGTATIDGLTVNVGTAEATTVNLATSDSATVNIGKQSFPAANAINLGYTTNFGSPIVAVTSGSSSNNTVFAGFDGSNNIGNFLAVGPTFRPNSSHTGVSGIVCAAGGTFAVQPVSFGISVTTTTLTSNCVINFATSASNGLFILDMSGATVGSTFGIVFENGTATKTYLSTSVFSGTLAIVWTYGANTLAVTW